MHTERLDDWTHHHVFLGSGHGRNERRTLMVIALTAVTMVVEIAAGLAFGSMALLADGFHMATHVGALSITALAYLVARRYARDARFTFGTGKVGDLAGFSSALVLALAAVWIGVESVLRFLDPVAIRFDEAIAVAVLGLAVNLLSAWLLHGGGAGHGHHHHHEAGQAHDHNLRAAYLHVLADALTSLLAIAGLLAGRVFGWHWMDPLMGVVGALVILRWSYSLMRSTAGVLLDTVPEADGPRRIRDRLERNGDRVADLHLWRLGPGHQAVIVTLVSDNPVSPDRYKEMLAEVGRFSHATVEVHDCPHDP